MTETTYEAVAVRYWQDSGTPVLSHLAAGTRRACEDAARRCSIGMTDWPATAVREAGGGQVCCWWVAGKLTDKPPRAAGSRRRPAAAATLQVVDEPQILPRQREEPDQLLPADVRVRPQPLHLLVREELSRQPRQPPRKHRNQYEP